MSRIPCLVISLSLASSVTTYGGPVLLATWHVGNSFSTPQLVESARPALTYMSPENEIRSPIFEDFPPPPEYPGFMNETVSTDTDVDFSAFASFLTNGKTDELIVMAWGPQGPFGGGGGRETSLVFAVPSFGPDLVGYEIEYATEALSVDLQSPGSDPFSNGINTDWSVSGIYEFYGTPIPEPTSLFLFASGGLLTVLQRRKRLSTAQRECRDEGALKVARDLAGWPKSF